MGKFRLSDSHFFKADSLFLKLKNQLSCFPNLSKGDGILISLSGGVDSTSLLVLMCTLSQYKISVAHINHNLRKESNDEEKFVKNLSYSDIWLHNYKNKDSRAILSYIWNLRSFTDYIQQLEMESLGKQPSKESEFKKTGQIIFGGYGPKAQHSYFQLLHQGTQGVCADIIASKEDKKSLAYAQAITQSQLLSQGAEDLKDHERINGNIPTNLFIINRTSLYEIGYLLATWEHRTYITSVMLGINPFDQYGVSAGKIFTRKYLEENGG